MKPVPRLAILAAIALLPVLPYAIFGYAGQDLPFHVASWIELRDAHFVPGWSPGANFGLGDPHLLFYPPLSIYLGAFLTRILPIQFAPAAFIWIAVCLSGLTMYYAARPFLTERDRIIAAILYMLNPYLLTTALVRFAAAELLVQAILPLILLCLYAAFYDPDFRRSNRATLLLSILSALTWLTDIPAAIVLLYGLLPVAAIAAWQRRSFAPILRFAVAESMAALLAAFYLVPIVVEQKWISRGSLVAHDPGQLLLFMPQSSPADSALVIACWIFACVAALVLAVSLRRRIVLQHRESATSFLTTTALVAIAFQLPFAYALWHHLPELATAQFPFRFLPLLYAPLSLLLLAPTAHRSIRLPVYALLAFAGLLPFLGFAAMQTGSASHQPPLAERMAKLRQQGYKGAPEYLPAGDTAPASPPDSAALKISTGASLAKQCVTLSEPSSRSTVSWNSSHFTTSCPAAVQERLPVFYYSAWRATDESRHLLRTGRDPSGLLLIDIPPGDHTLTLTFHSASRLRIASAAFSLVVLLVVAPAALHPRRRRPAERIRLHSR